MIPHITVIIQKYSNIFVICEYKKRVVYINPNRDTPYICVYNEFGSVSHYNWRTLNIREYSSIYRNPTDNNYRYTVSYISPNYHHQQLFTE